MEWTPISELLLWDEINHACLRMTQSQKRLWEVIRIDPQKWRQHPHGDIGGGFWVVALIGNIILWYNDIEGGFNESTYEQYGTIKEYWCNQDELELTVQRILNRLSADL